MTRLKKELMARGIIYNAPDNPSYIEQDEERHLVDIVDEFIITVWYSAVLDPEIHIFNRRTLKMVGGQDLRPDRTFWGQSRTWGSFAIIEEEI